MLTERRLQPPLVTFWKELAETLLDASVAAAVVANKQTELPFFLLLVVLLFCSFFPSYLRGCRQAGRQLHHFLEVVIISKLTIVKGAEGGAKK